MFVQTASYSGWFSDNEPSASTSAVHAAFLLTVPTAEKIKSQAFEINQPTNI